MRRSALLTGFITVLVSASTFGCATAGTSAATSAQQDREVFIDSNEINSTQDPYAIDVIKHVRPRWLSLTQNSVSIGGGGQGNVSTMSGIQRATDYAVFLDNVKLGGQEMLKTISTSEIASIRFYDTAKAAGLPGIGGSPVFGAIVITSRR